MFVCATSEEKSEFFYKLNAKTTKELKVKGVMLLIVQREPEIRGYEGQKESHSDICSDEPCSVLHQQPALRLATHILALFPAETVQMCGLTQHPHT